MVQLYKLSHKSAHIKLSYLIGSFPKSNHKKFHFKVAKGLHYMDTSPFSDFLKAYIIFNEFSAT